ncbi:MAG: hypothetical protein LZF86_190403 [Nitrospira sp.]|nr:MAG: hypothetical protein LZF86_190403 [Nitrospira sp.]
MTALKIKDAQPTHGKRNHLVWAGINSLIIRATMNDPVVHLLNPCRLVRTCDTDNPTHKKFPSENMDVADGLYRTRLPTGCLDSRNEALSPDLGLKQPSLAHVVFTRTIDAMRPREHALRLIQHGGLQRIAQRR